MRTFNVIVERDPDTGLFVGSVPGWPGAHSQGASFDELEKNLREEVVAADSGGRGAFSEFTPAPAAAELGVRRLP